mmetsp:Transcript_39349/g.82274  ORF Transcript_39349/g.82274 Transcript_39349/m.82274 type:complete len:308 (-) Transcript_39349:733-1656(-)
MDIPVAIRVAEIFVPHHAANLAAVFSVLIISPLHISRLDAQYPRLQLRIANQTHVVRRQTYQPSPYGQRRLGQIRSDLVVLPPAVPIAVAVLLQVQIALQIEPVVPVLLPNRVPIPSVLVGDLPVQRGVRRVERPTVFRRELVRVELLFAVRSVASRSSKLARAAVGIGRCAVPRMPGKSEPGLTQSASVPPFRPPALGTRFNRLGEVEHPSSPVVWMGLFEVSLCLVGVITVVFGIHCLRLCAWYSMRVLAMSRFGCCYFVYLDVVHVVEEGTFSHDAFFLFGCRGVGKRRLAPRSFGGIFGSHLS